jgi:hypothetical protein
MVSAIKSRPNYYDMLGIMPGASGTAIAQAFGTATSVFRPHAFGAITELCVAYETLRDPARRRAYDASIGLPEQPRLPVSRPASAHFMARPAVDSPLLPEPKVEAAPPVPAIERRPIQPDIHVAPPPAGEMTNAGYSPIEWKGTAKILGGLVAVAILAGAITGWWSGSSAAEPEQAAPAAAADKDKPAPSFSDLWPEPEQHEVAPSPAQPKHLAGSNAKRAAGSRQLAASEAEAQLIRPPQDLIEPAAADPLAPEAIAAPAPARSVASAMPLPHRTVARTIDRIGYNCGSVASSQPIEGATGAYKVTCTSGQSFQAKPVNGRYRFRRLAGN